MANVENLTPFTSEQSREEAVKNGQKGGIASGESRRNKKAMREILAEILDSPATSNPLFAELAAKMGIEEDKSVKDMFALVCLINSLKEGNLADLERAVKLLGEDKQNENEDVIAKLDAVLGKVDDLAK